MNPDPATKKQPSPSLPQEVPTNTNLPANTSPTAAHVDPVKKAVALVDPDVALTLTLVEVNKSESVANRVPGLKKSAVALIGLALFSAVQSFIMQGISVSMMGAQPSNGSFVTVSSSIGWIAAIICSIIALITKSPKTAKTVLLIVGFSMAYFLIIAVKSTDIIGGAIDCFILWRVFVLYQSVEVLEI